MCWIKRGIANKCKSARYCVGGGGLYVKPKSSSGVDTKITYGKIILTAGISRIVSCVVGGPLSLYLCQGQRTIPTLITPMSAGAASVPLALLNNLN